MGGVTSYNHTIGNISPLKWDDVISKISHNMHARMKLFDGKVSMVDVRAQHTATELKFAGFNPPDEILSCVTFTEDCASTWLVWRTWKNDEPTLHPLKFDLDTDESCDYLLGIAANVA